MDWRNAEVWAAIGTAVLFLWRSARGQNLSKLDKLVELGWHVVEGWATKQGKGKDKPTSIDKEVEFKKWWASTTGKEATDSVLNKARDLSRAKASPSMPSRWF